MRGVNKVIIVGTLGADPESRQFDNGGMVANVSVATSEQWTDKQSGEKRESTEWHRIVFNGRLAEIAAQYLRKGSKVYIEGSIKTRKYQQDGIDKYVTEIRAMQLQMLDSAPAGNGNQGGGNSNGSSSYSKPAGNTGYSNQAAASQPSPTGYAKTNQSSKKFNAAGEEVDEFGKPIDSDIPF